MKYLGDWLQSATYRLVVWLISTWGSALVLIGTMALAASGAAYLTGSYELQAPAGRSIPHAGTSIPGQPWCAIRVGGRAITCTGTFPPYPCAQTLQAVVWDAAPDSACDHQ
jgi:hypothetical protein